MIRQPQSTAENGETSAPEEEPREALGDPLSEERAPARSFEEPSFKDSLVSAGLWGLGLGFLVPALGSMTAVYQVVHPQKVNILGKLYCKGQLALTGSRWRAEVHPDVDPSQPYIFAQNHTNHFDHVMLYNATPHFKQGLELESHFDIPVYGWFMKSRGTVPVRSGRGGQTPEVLARIQRECDEGRSILAFPEGTRTRTGRVGRFRRGIFFIARDLGIPIVPSAVTGSFDVMRAGSWVIRPGNDITVYCDKPVQTAGLTDDEVHELADDVQATVSGRVDDYWESRS